MSSKPSARPVPKVLIVDGHSMIFQWPQLRALHDRKTATAREQLVRLLTQYQDASGTHVIAVFDGKGARRASEDEFARGIQVFYSGSGETADSIIERLVAKYAAQYAITVATDDHLERQTVESFGGDWMSSDQLAAEIVRAEGELGERIRQLRRR